MCNHTFCESFRAKYQCSGENWETHDFSGGLYDEDTETETRICVRCGLTVELDDSPGCPNYVHYDPDAVTIA